MEREPQPAEHDQHIRYNKNCTVFKQVAADLLVNEWKKLKPIVREYPGNLMTAISL